MEIYIGPGTVLSMVKHLNGYIREETGPSETDTWIWDESPVWSAVCVLLLYCGEYSS